MEVGKMKLNFSFANPSALFLFLVIFSIGWSTSAAADCELAKLLAADGALGDKFGYSVAVFGGAAVFGAFNDDDNGSNTGSAYVFRFDGSNWIQEQKLTVPDAAAEDYFGSSVSIFGDTIAIGAPQDDDSGSSSGSVYIFRFNGTCWVQEQKLIASDGATFDHFGASVAVSGDTVVIGSPYDGDMGNNSGSAYVFRYDGSNWIQEIKLIAADGMLGDEFGYSVGAYGDIAVIGSPSDNNSNGNDSGSAYIFRFNGSSWTQEIKLLASDGAVSDIFGNSVAVCGDIAVVGAYLDDDMGNNSGSAYVFRFDGLHWNQEAKLIAPDGAAGDNFAKSVAISGDTVVIGADHDDDHGENSGSGHVFRFTGSSWIHETKLVASDGASGDYFGDAVSISGDTIVIGASYDDDKGSSSGSAYIFGLEGSTWEEKLLASDGMETDFFGMSVALSGDAAIVGAYYNDAIGLTSGAAYIYRFDGTSWFEEQKLIAFDGEAGDHFGYTVAISGDVAIVGAPSNSEENVYYGSAYVFRFDGTNWNQEQKLTTSDGILERALGATVAIFGDIAVIMADGDDGMGNRTEGVYVFRFNGLNWVEQAKLLAFDGVRDSFFGRSFSISGNTMVIGAAYDDDNGISSGAAYVFHYNGTNWVGQAKLLASDGAARDNFGDSVSISGDTVLIGAPADDDNGDYSGSAYVFRFSDPNWIQEAKLTAFDGAAEDRFGTTVAISGDTAVIGAYLDDNKGSVYVFHFDGSNWQPQRKLLASDGAEGDLFGFSAAISGDTVVIGANYDDDNGSASGSAYIFGLALNPGDLDRDNDVDLIDFGLLAQYWLEDNCAPCRCYRADFNRDGKCDLADLTVLTTYWLLGK